MIEDAGEIAQLASEYISSLENLPQEVQHIIKEIEHKDAKVQEVLPRLATREGQLRDLLARRETAISEADKTKAERLAEKIKTDYTHADEWNAQKEKLSLSLWRLLCAHAKRLDAEIAKISPALVTQVEATLSSQLPSIQASSNSISSAVLGALRSSPAIEASLDLGGTTPAAGLKRKLSGTPVAKARQSSADRGMPSPSPLGTSSTLGPAASTGSLLASSQKKMKHSGLSVVTKPENDVEADVEGTGNEEKDDRVYCHCQRVSFGEMIGCDNDDCPYEWFHLSCVGVSKPLPQTWYCQDCRDRMERDKAERPVKKRKKQQSTAS